MAKENLKENAQDKTVRLILGIILVLIALPGFGMFMWTGGMGMMFEYGFGWFSIFWLLAVIAIFVLGLYLIIKNLKLCK